MNRQVVPFMVRGLFSFLVVVMAGCAAMDETPNKNKELGLITTPPTYYTTQKAKYLGAKYKNNLDRLVELIVRNPKTATLQFANNIASAGGIGFFTHSATSRADERFLEVVMGVPETFDSKLDSNTKVSKVFSAYGVELLSILSSDRDIYEDQDVSGYGLNFSWRNIAPEPNGPRVTLERAVLYFPKGRVQSFLAGKLTQNVLLGEAVIFAVIGDSPMRLVSFRPQEFKTDSRLPIQEETIATENASSKSEGRSATSSKLSPPTEIPESVPTELSSLTGAPLELPTPASQGIPKDSAAANEASRQQSEVPSLSSSASVEPAEPEERPLSKTAFRSREPVAPSNRSAVVEQTSAEMQSIVSNDSRPLAEARALALSHKRDESVENEAKTAKSLERQLVSLPSPAPLQGFIIQITFANRSEAKHWAQIFERQGYTVSMTEAASAGSVRVRIGSFLAREQAERRLQILHEDGLKGIVLNLPQAYRPKDHSVGSEDREKSVSAVQ